MDHIYYLIILSVIIGSPVVFIKQDILRDFSIFEQLIYTNIILLPVFILLYYLYEKKSLKTFLDKTKSTKFNKLLLYTLLIGIGLIISGVILQNINSVVRFKGIQRSLSIILLTLIGCCIYKEKFTMNMFSGIICILLGINLLEK
jgi:drug/metabolite transporter (DMT)-like permease|tara:strand:+ start:680 stop:1114 length:435 start_codon:yes stop_codon:yes gene_type:complete